MKPLLPSGNAAAQQPPASIQFHPVLDVEELRDAIFAHLSLQDRVAAAQVSRAWADTALRARSWQASLPSTAMQLPDLPPRMPLRPQDGLDAFAVWRGEQHWKRLPPWFDHSELLVALLVASLVFLRTHSALARMCVQRSCDGNPVCAWNPKAYCQNTVLAPSYLAAGLVLGVGVGVHFGLWLTLARACEVWPHRSRPRTPLELEPYAQMCAAARLQEYLTAAVRAGEAETVKALLNHGASPDFFRQGSTLLELAIEKGDEPVARELLAHGAHFEAAALVRALSKCPESATLMGEAMARQTPKRESTIAPRFERSL